MDNAAHSCGCDVHVRSVRPVYRSAAGPPEASARCRSSTRGMLWAAAAVLWLYPAVPAGAQDDRTVVLACPACHATQAEEVGRSVHAKADFDCRQCHGGEQVYTLAASNAEVYTRQAAKDAVRPAFDHGGQFRGKLSRLDVPQLCGDCHANVERMIDRQPLPDAGAAGQSATFRAGRLGLRVGVDAAAGARPGGGRTGRGGRGPGHGPHDSGRGGRRERRPAGPD